MKYHPLANDNQLLLQSGKIGISGGPLLLRQDGISNVSKMHLTQFSALSFLYSWIMDVISHFPGKNGSAYFFFLWESLPISFLPSWNKEVWSNKCMLMADCFVNKVPKEMTILWLEKLSSGGGNGKIEIWPSHLLERQSQSPSKAMQIQLKRYIKNPNRSFWSFWFLLPNNMISVLKKMLDTPTNPIIYKYIRYLVLCMLKSARKCKSIPGFSFSPAPRMM